ncbi:BadF/BadG/BcrA/BcrD ATPase family protein [Halomonas sp. HP20-15]|uniref:N-acetylglucosamine kinase n=1 Tax=Halomonas sp. HP20-15 TaxID=3085901 RepID=UPI002980C620|nr:BadF/BadG/BcrA/BcrD ATPase family protein [Halomonas sp. HP20-15]MDW5377526.1 BadF/BadG/BcrA/BcrD ATPase family protein [Halomonas sp. HP20-15]
MFLGIDGGGTKTAFCLLSSSGEVIATAERSTCYYLSVGMDEVHRVLDDGIREICREAEISLNDIDHAFFGLPAYGEGPQVIDTLDNIPKRILGHRRYTCGNDMICGWAGSLGAKDGINVIAGTGSMTYGENGGHGFRCGGWGEIFGDEGSAYWIACRGLNVFTRMSDGRLEKEALYDLISKKMMLTDDLELIDIIINQWDSDRARIAELATLVIDAAHLGDRHALKILSDSAYELAQLVDVTRRNLNFDTVERIPVSYSGGVFRDSLILEAFSKNLAGLGANYELRDPLYSPAVGAALYAAKLVNIPIQIKSI